MPSCLVILVLIKGTEQPVSSRTRTGCWVGPHEMIMVVIGLCRTVVYSSTFRTRLCSGLAFFVVYPARFHYLVPPDPFVFDLFHKLLGRTWGAAGPVLLKI